MGLSFQVASLTFPPVSSQSLLERGLVRRLYVRGL